MSIVDLEVIDDHERFRAELASIQPDGRRRWIYALKPPSRFYYKARTIVAWILLAFFFVAPFVKVGGHQFLLLNVIDREFVFFGVPFWPNDFYLVALMFLTAVVTVVVFTATIGRIWCGWMCPQTIFLEMVFRKIEWFIEGGPKTQAKRNAGPWNWDRTWRVLTKGAVFGVISFAIANTFLSYVVSSDVLIEYVQYGPSEHLELFIALVAFTFVFFMVFYRFREQACLIACPYGRYMSALVDENTVAVTYDYKRGEGRKKWSREDREAKKAATEEAAFNRPSGSGACVDCHQCVTVCPTGIDIRNGIQLECVNCTACMDACDDVMEKVGMDTGLIRYTSLNAVEKGHGSWLTTRIKAYGAIWIVMMLSVITLFAYRSDLDVVVLRQEGTTWIKMDQNIGNIYRLQIINKSADDLAYSLKVVEPANAGIMPLGLPEFVGSQEIMKGRFILTMPNGSLKPSSNTVTIAVESNGEIVKTVTTSFVGP